MKQKQVYITEPQFGALRAHAAQSGTTESEVVRRALDQYLTGQADNHRVGALESRVMHVERQLAALMAQ